MTGHELSVYLAFCLLFTWEKLACVSVLCLALLKYSDGLLKLGGDFIYNAADWIAQGGGLLFFFL